MLLSKESFDYIDILNSLSALKIKMYQVLAAENDNKQTNIIQDMPNLMKLLTYC